MVTAILMKMLIVNLLCFVLFNSQTIILLGQSAQQRSVQNESKQQTDFSGKWSLESRNGTKIIGDKVLLIISQTGPEMKMVQESSQGGVVQQRQRTYYTDGRGETNNFDTRLIRLNSITKLKKKALVIKYSLPSIRENNTLVVNEWVEEWILSKDGQTLTRTSSFSLSSSTTDASNNPYSSPRSQDVWKTPLTRKTKESYKRL
jgi:hypothetical protein